MMNDVLPIVDSIHDSTNGFSRAFFASKKCIIIRTLYTWLYVYVYLCLYVRVRVYSIYVTRYRTFLFVKQRKNFAKTCALRAIEYLF